MHKFEMVAFHVKMDASLRYFINLVTLHRDEKMSHLIGIRSAERKKKFLVER